MRISECPKFRKTPGTMSQTGDLEGGPDTADGLQSLQRVAEPLQAAMPNRPMRTCGTKSPARTLTMSPGTSSFAETVCHFPSLKTLALTCGRSFRASSAPDAFCS